MKKMRVAIIGQGRSGLDIHGKFFLSDANKIVEVVAVVDRMEYRREKAKKLFGCDVYAEYTELFGRTDIDLVVNATYSQMHYEISRDLLLHGFNVLAEKPFGRTWVETQDLIHTAEQKGLVIAAFHQSLFAPNFVKVKETIASGILGDIHQIDFRYSGFARRWDWQTLQCFCAGGVYNTGPHPIGQALDLLGWDPEAKVAFAQMNTVLTIGDGNDYAKIILTAPGKPVMDVEINSADANNLYTFKVCGSKGGMTVNGNHYKIRYANMDALPEREVIRDSLYDANGNPAYCWEKLEWTEDEGDVVGSSFDIGVEKFYTMVYDRIFNGKPMEITPQMASEVIRVIENCHTLNPLPVRYGLAD